MIRETRRELALVAVNKDKIDIGTVVQLAPAKFAQRQNRKFRFGRAVLLAKLTVPVVEYAPDADFGDLRQLSRRFFERGGTGFFSPNGFAVSGHCCLSNKSIRSSCEGLSESAAFSLIHQCTTNQDTRLECGDYLRSRERCCPAGHAALFSCHNLFACPGKTATFPS